MARQPRLIVEDEANADAEMNGMKPDQASKDQVADEGYQTQQADTIPTPASSANSSYVASGIPSSFRSASTNEQESGVHVVGRGVKKLFDVINKLEQLGVENITQMPLPKIVVVGDQSAGKSSLIEAISEIKVPRAAGTCTRCPLQINLAPNDERGATWVCQVTLHKQFDFFQNLPTPPQSPEKDAGFGPWRRKQIPEDIPFRIVHKKEDLERILRQAQKATLNPHDHPAKYASSDDDLFTSDLVQFSPNVVRLDISGPALGNLSFYDLPGVINQTENNEEPYLVGLVKNLVREYIHQPNTVVLLACSMETDVANSYASKLVRKAQADVRSVGVLTKPDRLPSGGDHQLWQAMLEGDKFELGHGYFVTRQPSQSELEAGIDHATAREKELAFFDKEVLWSDQLSKFKDRFGTFAIQTTLSDLLARQILENLPEISHKVQSKVDEISLELENMPEPPAENSARIVYAIVNKFQQELTTMMTGDNPNINFNLEWNEQVIKFRKAMISMKPTLVVKTAGEQDRAKETSGAAVRSVSPAVHRASAPISLESDDEPDTPSPASRKRPLPKAQVSPPKRKKNAVPSQRSGGSSSNPAPNLYTHETALEFAKRLTLDEIRQKVHEMSTFTGSDMVNPRVVDTLINLCIRKWDIPITEFLNRIEVALQAAIDSILTNLLSRWSQTELASEIRRLVGGFIRDALKQLRAVAQRFLEYERFKPKTFNEKSLEANRLEELELFQRVRADTRTELLIEEQEAQTGRATIGPERKQKIKQFQNDEKKKALLGPDDFAREVEVMARVRGYYTVASLRLVDMCALSIQLDLIEPCKQEIFNHLLSGLKVDEDGANAYCTRLLSEEPEKEARRVQLKQEKAKLVEAKLKLAELEHMSWM